MNFGVSVNGILMFCNSTENVNAAEWNVYSNDVHTLQETEIVLCMLPVRMKERERGDGSGRKSGNGIKKNCRLYLTKRKIKRISVI